MKNFFLLTICLFFSASLSGVTLNFSQMPLTQLLTIIARQSNENVIFDQAIQGKVSFSLQSVTWPQALQAIVSAQGLVVDQQKGVLWIRSPSTATQSVDGLPLRLFRLHYVKPSEVLKLLDHEIDKTGLISADDANNVLLVRGSASLLLEVNRVIALLDRPSPQVLIRAQIVSIDRHDVDTLGVQYNITNKESQKNGNAPIAVLPGQVGILEFAMSGARLAVALSALESQGRAQIIASPELMTADQQEASLEAGQEIPYQQQQGEGTTSVAFKKAVLSIGVRPEILPHGELLLHLKVTQDHRGADEVNGVPTIDTRQITTHVVVKNNQTLVLGGIFEQDEMKTTQRVPFISSFPIMGALFRYNRVTNQQRELLIFVTPTMKNESLT